MNTLDQFSTMLRAFWKPLLVLAVGLLAVSWIWTFINQGTLKLTVEPAPATLFLERKTYQVSENSEFRLSPGVYRTVVRKDGYLDYVATVTVRERETTTLQVFLLTSPVKVAGPVEFPAFTADGGRIRYLGADGRLRQVEKDGNGNAPLSEPIFPDVLSLDWSPDRSRVVFTTINYQKKLELSKSPFLSRSDPDLSETTWVYDLNSKKATKLSSGITTAVWSVDGKKIFYHREGVPSTINEANTDGTNERELVKITEFRSDQVVLRPSPDGKKLAWFPQSESYGASNIYLTDLLSRQSEKLTSDNLSQGAAWSTDSKRLLINLMDSADFSSTLTVLDLDSKSRQTLSVGGGAENSVWASNQIIYVFDPQTRTISRASVDTGDVVQLVTIEKGAASDFIIDSDGEALFYLLEGFLYRLSLE